MVIVAPVVKLYFQEYLADIHEDHSSLNVYHAINKAMAMTEMSRARAKEILEVSWNCTHVVYAYSTQARTTMNEFEHIHACAHSSISFLC